MEDPIKKSVGLVQADMEANCIEHGVRGILKHSDIERMMAEYTDDDRQARVYGRFQHLTGLVYKSWSRNIHVIKPFAINLRDFCVYERLDIHPRNPDACMWGAVDRQGRKYIVDELYGNYTTEELIYRIKQKSDNFRIIDRKIDPSAFIVDQHTNNSLAQRMLHLSNYSLRYTPASKERTMATVRTKDALDYQLVNGNMVKAPELYVFDTCVRTIFEFEHWQYNEYTGKAAERKHQSEKPQDKDDHMMENLGRFLIDEPAFYELPVVRSTFNMPDDTSPSLDPYQ